MLPEQKYNYDVMAIGAHPDDVEHAIGGTLLHLREQNKSICIVHMTHGEAGTFGDSTIRDREAHAAAKMLNADVRWMDFPDTRVEDTIENRLKMIKVIREVRPRLILCQYYDFPMMHHDHEVTGQIVRNSFRMSRFKNVDTGNDPFWIPNIAYYLIPHHVRPTFVVNVTPYMEQWQELAAAYDSQYLHIPGYKDRLLGHKRMAGFMIDEPFGEAFVMDRPAIANHIDITKL